MTCAALFLLLGAVTAATAPATRPVADPRYRVGELLFADDFAGDLSDWSAELAEGGTVAARDGKLVIDVPAGCTVWFKPRIEGPVMIEYEATVVAKDGKNDRVSDLNCFWMASDARSPDDLFATQRSGKFEDYHQLRAYYVGLGGNTNTTTRFRRYIGDAELRPLLPEHDLREPPDLITANQPQTIRLVACGKLIQYWRDGRKLFEMIDDEPYDAGHFGFRTVTNHMEIRRFRVYRLKGE